MAQVGSLHTSLTLESASFVSGLKKATDAAERNAKLMTSAFNAVKIGVGGLLAGGLVNELTQATARALEYADAIADTAQKIGTAASFLQEFRFAAEQTGSGFETADAGLERFVNTLGDAERGSERAQKLLRGLGVTSTDQRTAFLQAADGVKNMKSSTEQLSVATDLFGRKNAGLVTLLRQGSEGFNQLARDANALGVVLSDQVVNGAGAANDRLAATKRILDAQFANFISQNATAIIRLATNIGTLTKNLFDFLRLTSGSRLRDTFLDTGATELQAERWAKGFEATGAADFIMAAIEDRKKKGPLTQQAILEAAREGVAAQKRAAQAFADAGGGTIDLQDLAPKLTEPKAEKDQLLEYLKDLQSNPIEIYRPDSQSDDPILNGRLQKNLDGLAASVAEIDERGAFQMMQLGEAAEQRAAEFERMRDFADQAAASITSGFEDAIIEGRKFGDVIKALIEDIARLAIRQAILRPLSNGIAGALGGLFGGARAAGGPVSGEKSYLVGERGPEMFMPGRSGTIIPAGALRGLSRGGGQQQLSVTVSAEPGLKAEVAMIGAQSGQQAALSVVKSARNRGIDRI